MSCSIENDKPDDIQYCKGEIGGSLENADARTAQRSKSFGEDGAIGNHWPGRRTERVSMPPVRIITHSRFVIDQAVRYGWQPGARYTNLRDVRHLSKVYFVDIDWKNYDFERHLHVTRQVRPALTVARDIVDADQIDLILAEARALARHAATVVVVPKDPRLVGTLRLSVPKMFRLGYSVPTRYGGTSIPASNFVGDVHLLGGRPDVQRRLANDMNVLSLDGNRFTLDAKFGDYFDGKTFRPHPVGGYATCLDASLQNISKLWSSHDG